MGLGIIIGIITLGFGIDSWHHFAQFRRRRHPMSVPCAMVPLCGVLAALLSLSAPTWQRVVSLAFCLTASLGAAATVFYTRRKEKQLQGLIQKLEELRRA